MKKKLFKAAVIGLGVGMHHVEALEKHPNCSVKKVYDFNRSKFSKLKRVFPNIEFVKNENEIFLDKEINIVSIASFDNFHYDQIIKCIKYKKNIIVEKPICLNQKQLNSINNKINKTNLKITSNMVLRTTGMFKQIKKKFQIKK